MHRIQLSISTLVTCGCLILVGGCSDDDSTGNDNNNHNVGDDAGVDAGPDAAIGESLELIILDGTDPDNVGQDASPVPVVDAMVAFDLPSGERVERTTNAEGRVTIYGIDWSQGQAAVTGYKQGYGIVSFVNLDASDFDSTANPFIVTVNGAYAMYLFQMAPPAAEITVTGTATHLSDVSHSYTVTTLRSLVASQWSGAGLATFSVTAPENEPFTLQAIETTPIGTLPSGQGSDIDIHRAMELNVDPTAGPTLTVALDFDAGEIPIYTEDASMVLPPRPDSPLRDGMPYLLVGAAGGNYSMGWATPVDISADGNFFEGTVSWVEPTLVTDPFIFFMVHNASLGSRSVIIEPGFPQPGLNGLVLYDLPRWITPSDPLTAYPMHDPLEWELFDDWTVCALVISRSGLDIWRVAAGGNATTLTVPQPPSNVNASSFLGTSFQAHLVGGLLDPEADYYDRYVESPVIRLSR